MTKLFASDFDGTLCFHDQPGPLVAQRDLEAIEAFRAAGGLFGVCTGRALGALTMQTAGVIDFDFYITTTGAALYDGTQQLLWRKTIPRETCQEMYEHYATRLAAGEYQILVAGDDYWALGDTKPLFPLPHVASFDDVEGPFFGFSIETVTVEEATAYAADLNERYAGIALAHQNLNSIDVVPAGCTKGAGLARIAEHFGATLTAGMGDSLNDLPLLEAADVAYTFNRCDERVRAAADVLVDHASEALRDFMAR